eukprot:jgi/Chrzof1/9710/Cz04g13010.t1
MEASEGFREPTYSFSEWWLNTKLADVELTISEGEGSHAHAPETRANKRCRQEPESNNSITIPVHGLILSKGSEYFRTQLNTRVGPNTNGSKMCSIEVGKGDLNVAKADIQSLYMGIPNTLTQVCVGLQNCTWGWPDLLGASVN